MSLDPKSQAALALHRFGLGPRPGAIEAIASDPRGALLAELDQASAGRIDDASLAATPDILREVAAMRLERRQAKAAKTQSMDDASTEPAMPQRARSGMAPPQRHYVADAQARFGVALDADTGFVERLVWFWSNHFAVSAGKGVVRGVAGAFEREAIRPHVLGRFADMLFAVESHPAMLAYLDNARSIGPNSVAGRNRKRGLNENLAREILELHTLGVRTGYTQDDVTRFANAITGWSMVPLRNERNGGEFIFNERMHEPGAQTVLGKSYADSGFAQGKAVLADLAAHPATAKHIATKLATHFVADNPPLRLVERLAQRFRESDGDLAELARTLLRSDEAWTAPRGKLKRPSEWVVAALRAIGTTTADAGMLLRAHNALGEPLWRPPSPKGFPDDAASWLDGLAQRLDVANQLGREAHSQAEPDAIVDAALGPLASRETRAAVARAGDRPQALTLLLMSAEFQRR